VSEWLTRDEAARVLGVGPEAVRRRALKGVYTRKWCGTARRHLYNIGAAPTAPEPERRAQQQSIACYIPARDIYLVTKDGRRRPQIVDGWLGRAILDVERDTIASIDNIKIEKPVRLPRLKVKGKEGGFSVVVGLTDFHFGKLGDAASNADWNMDKARAVLMSTCEQAINTALRFGQPEEFILPVGSDFLNADTDQGTTTQGTGVDNAGTWQVMFTRGVQLFSDVCECLRAVAPVRLLYMPGNHDRTSSLALMQVMRATYNGADDVTLSEGLTERQYVEIGSTLAAFHHGDKIKMQKIGQIMSVEASEAWGRAEHKVAFSGHLHHERVIETDSGVICVQMPSLSDHDRYHHRGGYVSSRRSLGLYIIDHVDGLVGQLNAVA